MNKILLFLLLIASVLLIGCTSFKAKAPKNFAEYDMPWYKTTFKAISPEGLLYSAYSVDNSPYADIEFWAEAMTNRMKNAGYLIVKEDSIMVHNHKGTLLEMATPVGIKDYTYIVAIVPYNDEILIVESAGEINTLQKSRENIIEAIQGIEL
ncbi:MAG: hypothetical protein OCD76_15095 [Reichenbachiella sp.]